MDQNAVAPIPPPVTIDPPPLPARAPSAGPASAPVFTPDTLSGSDSFGHDAAIAPVAEMIAHAGAQTPMTVGIFGGPGSGKSSAAIRLAARVMTLANGAARSGLKATPYLPRIQAIRVSAADIVGEPACAIAEAIRQALLSNPSSAALATEASHAAADPHVAAREAAEHLDAARSRLDIERKALDDLEGRKVRLVDTLLEESGGSRLEAFARANRASIEARLSSFGVEGDAFTAFKDLARGAAERSGPLSALSALLKTMTSFKGQGRLLVWAGLAFFLAAGCDAARDNSAVWLNALRGMGEQAGPLADWAAARVSWLITLRQIANVSIFVFLGVNTWRALRFLAPIRRGAALLTADIEERRGRIDAAIAHQTRRVDSLSRDVETHAAAALEAEKRAAGAPGSGAVPASPFANPADVAGRARAFVDYVSTAMAREEEGAPRRIMTIVDDLGQTSPARAAAIFEAAHRLLSRDGFVAIVAVDPDRLAGAWGGPAETASQLDRLVQLPLRLPDASQDSDRMADFARGLASGGSPGLGVSVPDPSRSILDVPLRPSETVLLGALAPLAAHTPRAAKRFVNLYRLARGRRPDSAPLALMLAIDAGANSSELAVMGAAMEAGAEDALLAFGPQAPRLEAALTAANKARGAEMTIADARAAWAVARDYRMPL